VGVAPTVLRIRRPNGSYALEALVELVAYVSSWLEASKSKLSIVPAGVVVMVSTFPSSSKV